MRASRLAGATLAMLSLLSAADRQVARAKICPNIEKHFTINTANLVAGLSDTIPGLTEDEAEYWALYAVQQVVMQSGAGLRLVYDGRTTRQPACQGVGTPDGVATIGALDISAVGWTAGEDICVDSGRTFHVTESPPTDPSNLDLVGVLMHEVMHWVGVNASNAACLSGMFCDSQGHVDDTTLDSAVVSGTITQRTLTGHDKRRLRYLASIANPTGCPHQGGGKLRFARATHAAFPPVWVPNSYAPDYRMVSGPGVAMGRGSSTSPMVVTAIPMLGTGDDEAPAGMRFLRASAASGLDQSGDFTSTTYTGSNFQTFAAPAVAARTSGSARWVAAWPRRADVNYVCPGIRIVVSTNEFATISNQLTLTPGCTAQQVALQWDPRSGRFILAYVYHSPLYQHYLTDPADPWNAVIVVHTSTDGIAWTNGQVLGKTTATPGLACSTTECTLTHPNSGLLGARVPAQITWKFTVDSAGQLVIGNASSDFIWQASKVDTAYMAGPFGAPVWLHAHWGPHPWFWSADLYSATLRVSGNTSALPSSYTYATVDTQVRFPVEIASVPDNLSAYLLYVK